MRGDAKMFTNLCVSACGRGTTLGSRGCPCPLPAPAITRAKANPTLSYVIAGVDTGLRASPRHDDRPGQGRFPAAQAPGPPSDRSAGIDYVACSLSAWSGFANTTVPINTGSATSLGSKPATRGLDRPASSSSLILSASWIGRSWVARCSVADLSLMSFLACRLDGNKAQPEYLPPCQVIECREANAAFSSFLYSAAGGVDGGKGS